MANINWQNLWCRFGFHSGQWGEIYTKTTTWMDEYEPWNKDKQHDTVSQYQGRTCQNCKLYSRRKVR